MMIHFIRTHGTLGFSFFMFLFVTNTAEDFASVILSVATFFLAVQTTWESANGAGSAWRPKHTQNR